MAEVKDLENVEAGSDRSGDGGDGGGQRRPRGDARKPEGPVAGDPAEEAAPDHPPVHTVHWSAGDRRGGAAESAGRQEQR